MAQFSDTDGSAGKLADIVTCSVCLDPFTAPKTLQCHHSFCKQCLAKILHAKLVKEGVLVSTKKTVLEIECPNCKAKHGGVDTISAIKTNPNVNQMLAFYDEFTVKKQLGNEGKLCPCKEVAKYSCLRCTTCYCKLCYRNRWKWGTCRKSAHEKATESKHLFVGCQDTGEYICKIHELPLYYYCSACKGALCLDCYLAEHRDHHTTTVDLAWKGATQLFGQLKSSNDINQAVWRAFKHSADHVLQRLVKNEREVLQKLQKEQAKIQGLVSLLFEGAREHYKQVFAKEKEHVLQNVTERKYTDDAMKHFHPEDTSTTSRLCLVSGMHEMSEMLKCLEKESNDLKVNTLRVKEQPSSDFSLRINDREVFKSILELFGSIRLEPIITAPFCPSSLVTLETFISGDYESKENNAEQSTYQEEYLLQGARPKAIPYEELSSEEDEDEEDEESTTDEHIGLWRFSEMMCDKKTRKKKIIRKMSKREMKGKKKKELIRK